MLRLLSPILTVAVIVGSSHHDSPMMHHDRFSVADYVYYALLHCRLWKLLSCTSVTVTIACLLFMLLLIVTFLSFLFVFLVSSHVVYFVLCLSFLSFSFFPALSSCVGSYRLFYTLFCKYTKTIKTFSSLSSFMLHNSL